MRFITILFCVTKNQKMKKILFLALLYIPASVVCQSDLRGKVKQKAKARADQHVDAAIDKSMDMAEEEVTKQANKQMQANQTNDATESTASTNAKIFNEQKQQPASLKTYSRYDFYSR